jgi:hypothetical protein
MLFSPSKLTVDLLLPYSCFSPRAVLIFDIFSLQVVPWPALCDGITRVTDMSKGLMYSRKSAAEIELKGCSRDAELQNSLSPPMAFIEVCISFLSIEISAAAKWILFN